jgi:hypothetical protein
LVVESNALRRLFGFCNHRVLIELETFTHHALIKGSMPMNISLRTAALSGQGPAFNYFEWALIPVSIRNPANPDRVDLGRSPENKSIKLLNYQKLIDGNELVNHPIAPSPEN